MDYHEILGEYHRFVPVAKAMDYVRLGWLPLPTFAGTHHESHKVHVVWLCSCGERKPITPHEVRALKMAIIRSSLQRQFEYNRIATRRVR